MNIESIKKTFTEEEKIIGQFRASKLIFAIPWTLALICLTSIRHNLTDNIIPDRTSATYNLICGIILIVWPLIRYLTNYLVITNKRVIGKCGVINIKSLSSPLNKIDGVKVHQNIIISLIFGFGTVGVIAGRATYNFKYIYNPKQAEACINNAIIKYSYRTNQ